MDLALGLAACGKGTKAAGSILGENTFGKDRASRIAGAKEKDIEDAVWLTDAPCIRDIEADFQATLKQCRTVENDPRSIWQGRWLFRALGKLLKVLAPLL